eukprot:CAMPEP_0118679482 /NCGR_PEP_ID=MMETSP0800-20121206/3813_1 /TAXON_ID=210618 ORGANISM="Striatella unipunctata, Strain CCMP2910" /NCGR_SAMPLE_ID=MMETSP0800 /ASSEMBLY_ACC=CAM_ASM_000638 /LENGTH=388 /DNA_ID=CAMNT_0006575483 /DNA_START=30 /DNA_END=1196 /DNA_ORIENTATION=+
MTKPRNIAYVVTITGCGGRGSNWKTMLEGAAVLSHSIYMNSVRTPRSGSKYDFQMYAIVHPDARKCLGDDKGLERLGYKVLIKDVPIDPTKIRGKDLREAIVRSGCCQDKELLKLYGYTLVDHDAVVMVDLDVLVLNPLDNLFDSMLDEDSPVKDDLPIMFDKPAPPKINAFFTRDYGMLNPGQFAEGVVPGVQGGFIVIKPDIEVFEEYRHIILKGHFSDGRGWGDVKNGGRFWGDAQIQGLCSYYYEVLHPNEGVELNRCIYNSMIDKKYFDETNTCVTAEEECEDCEQTEVQYIKTVHFTVCQKPWQCENFDFGHSRDFLCNTLHDEWFRVRKNLEDMWAEKYDWTPPKLHEGKGDEEPIRLGYCKNYGERHYLPIEIPTAIPIR